MYYTSKGSEKSCGLSPHFMNKDPDAHNDSVIHSRSQLGKLENNQLSITFRFFWILLFKRTIPVFF